MNEHLRDFRSRPGAVDDPHSPRKQKGPDYLTTTRLAREKSECCRRVNWALTHASTTQ